MPSSVVSATGWRASGNVAPGVSVRNPALVEDVLKTLRPWTGLLGGLVINPSVLGVTAEFVVGAQDLEAFDTYLDGSATPIRYLDLPPGWRPTTAVIHVEGQATGDSSATNFARFGDDAAEGPVPFSYPHPFPDAQFPTAFDLYSIGWEFRIESTPTGSIVVGSSSTDSDGSGYISGDYEIVLYWWIIPDVDGCGERHTSRLKLSSEQPIAATGEGQYERLDPDDEDAFPQPVITAIEANHGPVEGGNSVTIRGSGFGEECDVTFDGVSATDIVVVSQYEIQCVVPSHAAGPVTVIVINPDGVTS